MKTYSCKVNLAGEIKNQVPKIGVTVPEILVLRVIHGDDAVVDIKVAGDVKRTDAEERDRLTALYGNALRGNDPTHKPNTINGIFGVATPLPVIVAGIEGVVMPDEPVQRRRVNRPKPEPVAEVEPAENPEAAPDADDDLVDFG